jgi:ABC-type sulfate/molybdate transport systems ATPase subunit
MEGRIVQVGRPQDIFARPATAIVAAFIGSPPMNLLPAEVRGGTLHVAGVDLPMGRALGADGPVTLAPFDSRVLADALEGLLADPERRRGRSEQGLGFVAGHTWDAAAQQVERELRTALRAREIGSAQRVDSLS